MPVRAMGPRRRRAQLVAFLIVLAAVAPLGYELGRWAAPSPPPNVAQVRLVIAFDPTTGDYGFLAPRVSIPVGSVLELTIVNYDPTNHTVAEPYRALYGTVGGIALTEGGSLPLSDWNSLPPDQIAHTFTFAAGLYSVNVPIPVASGPGHPSTITFTLRALWTVHTSWTCEAEDPSADPTTPDAMSGSFSVA